METTELTCQHCEASFTAKRNDAKYCSLKCRSRAAYLRRYNYYQNYWLNKPGKYEWRTERKCDICSSSFLPRNPNQKRCSQECVHRFKMDQKKKKREERRKVRPCEWCEVSFKPKTTIQRFCSERCATNKYIQKRGVKDVGRNNRTHNLTCLYCEKSFTVNGYPKRYCSPTCRNLAYKDKTRFTDGINSRSKNRRLRLEMDNYSCRKCGKDNYSRLTVHHNKYPATIDHLVTLCRACHAYVHKVEDGLYYP